MLRPQKEGCCTVCPLTPNLLNILSLFESLGQPLAKNIYTHVVPNYGTKKLLLLFKKLFKLRTTTADLGMI